MNTNCETYQNQLPAYVEGHLVPAAQEHLEAHLKDCPACRKELAVYEALTQTLYDTGVLLRRNIPAPVDLHPAEAEALVAAQAQEDAETVEEAPASDEGLEEALYALGADYRKAVPEIDLIDRVMAQVATEAETERTQDAEQDSFEDALYALGAALRQRIPRINLHHTIMARVAELQSRDADADKHTETVVDLAEYRQRQASAPKPARRSVFSNIAYWGLAASVLVLLSLASYQVLFSNFNDYSNSGIASSENGTSPSASQEAQGATDTESTQDLDAEMGDLKHLLDNLLADRGEQPQDVRPTRQALQSITLKDALDARSKAGQQDTDSINTLQQWAGLTSAEARVMLEEGALDADALIGAGMFLTPEEAVALLQEAIENNPDNPFLRYALAKNLGLHEGDQEAALEQLDAWAELDEDNALPHYYGALAHFAMGNTQAAMTALNTAENMDAASSYGLDAARYTEQLLLDSGMNTETARFLAGATAGSGQYTDLTMLSKELLEYGAYYESIGDYETAQEIYKSINQMGMQVADGAEVANERLAGLDIQHQSINAFEGLEEIFEDPVNLQILEQTFDNFVQALNEFSQYMEAYNELLAMADVDLANMIAEIILQEGDLDVFNHLPDSQAGRP